MWEVALQSLYFMMVCLSRPHEGFKPASAHFRMFWTTSGEDFVVTDGPLNLKTDVSTNLSYLQELTTT